MVTLFAALMLATACDTAPSISPKTKRLYSPPGTDIGLSHRADLVVDMSLPYNSRAEGQPTPEEWQITNPWAVFRSNDSVIEYTTKKPYRLLTYGEKKGDLPENMTLKAEGVGAIKFQKQRSRKIGRPNTWGLTHHKLVLRLSVDAPPPGDVWVALPKATREEVRRHSDTATLSQKNFVFRTSDLKEVRAKGLFLPAPASISFKITVPADAVFETTAHLLPPAISSGQLSDGAVLNVSLSSGATTVDLAEVVLGTDQSEAVRLDLSQWTGSEVSLHLKTGQQANPLFDYVFLQDPVVYAPQEVPNRVVFTIVDTLRSDHLGAYGYDRNTSPNIDAFASSSVLFEQTRSPSPWTLPSTLAALYGRAPEYVAGHSHLGELLGKDGWATCAIVSNNWLIGPDNLGAGWSEHWAQPQSPAAAQAKKSEECLQRYPNRNVLLFIHMIDPHTPYIEAKSFRHRFEKRTPKELKKRVIGQKVVQKALQRAKNEDQQDEIRQYLIDRYDQNILAVDAAFGEVLQQVGNDAVVVLTSDHGEEFFEHGGFEHGHTLFDEVLRVPLLIRAPGLAPHRVAAPTTSMDIVPTVLSLLEQPGLASPPHGTIGLSLVDAAVAATNSEDPLNARPLAIGFTIRGNDQWGTVIGGKKWTSNAATESLYDLNLDPKEQDNLADRSDTNLEPYPDWLSVALRRPVKRVLRISAHPKARSLKNRKYRLEVKHPAGIQKAWIANDVRKENAQPIMENGSVILPELAEKRTPGELFILLPQGATPTGLQVSLSSKTGQISRVIESAAQPANGSTILVAGSPENGFTIDTAWQPIPSQSEGVIFNGESTDDLRALGYIE
jgi:arylsulfatase A-like enzyme